MLKYILIGLIASEVNMTNNFWWVFSILAAIEFYFKVIYKSKK